MRPCKKRRLIFPANKDQPFAKLAAPVLNAVEKNTEDTDGFTYTLLEFCHLII